MPQQSFTHRSMRRPSFHKQNYRRGGGNQGRGPRKQYINPAKFVRPARQVQTEAYKPINKFDDFVVHDILKRNIAERGYIQPSKIQDIAIPHGLDGRDVVGIANTGTGKTIAFALPLLDKILKTRGTKAIVIAPTRELAVQIEEEFKFLAKNSGLFGALLIGGTNMGKQVRDLRGNPEIVIGTPGRIKDHVERGNLRLDTFNVVVLDEVDRMVDMGFINDIRFLLGKVAQARQSLFFSATMDIKIESLVNSFLSDPVTVSVKTGDTSDNVDQNVVYHGSGSDKMSKLHGVLSTDLVSKSIIFDDTKRGVERLSKRLHELGFRVDSLHGGKSQSQRQKALDRFRTNHTDILVATDVAARGLDITGITHVINYSTPGSYDDYIHRIGRAGRAGNTGYALTFVEQQTR